MNRLLTLIKKNFRLIMRSKTSAIMIILGPLLLIILMGAAFNTASIYGIRVGTFSENYSPLAESIIHELNQRSYSAQKVDSEQACIDGVRNSVFHVCAVFPKDIKVAEGGNIQFYVDNTKTNLVYLLTETISSEIGKKSEDLSFQLTKGVVDTLTSIESEINDRQDLIDELTAKNQENEVALNSISQDLVDMNLGYKISDIPISTLKSQLNGTASIGLNAVEKKINEVLDETSKAELKRKKISEKSLVLDQNTASEKITIQQIQATFNGIKKDISLVKETGVSNIVNPISSDIKPIAAEKTHLNFIFPTLLVMIIMFVSMLLTSTLEIRENTAKVYFKNFITPTSEALFTLSNYFTNLLIIALQTTILLGAAAYFFFNNITGSLGVLLLALFIIISIFLFLGITLGSIFKTEETNTITVISVGFIMVFFSSAILPIEILPSLIKGIATFNPFYISETLLNQIILFQSGFSVIKDQFILLAGYLAGAVIITWMVKKVTMRRQ